MNFHRAIRHRNLGNLADDAAERFHNSNSAGVSCRQRLAPAGFLGHRIEHSAMPRMFTQETTAKLVGILPRRGGELVHESFDDEALHRCTDGTPEAIRNSRIGFDVFNPDIRNVIRQSGSTIHGDAVDTIRRQGSKPFHK